MSWLHLQDIPVLNILVMVTLTGYSSVVCHGYIDRIFKCCMSWLHWQDIPVLNVFVVVTLTGYSSIECFGHGYIDRVFQYWMFWSWLHWQDIQVLNVLVMVTLTGYSSIECFGHGYIVTMTKTFNTGISCKCNHDKNIQYWNILSM
jgi:uncharacterized protein (UPF0254 family)